jgi:hypothetical protein
MITITDSVKTLVWNVQDIASFGQQNVVGVGVLMGRCPAFKVSNNVLKALYTR